MQNELHAFLISVKSICPEFTEQELILFSEKLNTISFDKKTLFIEAGQVQKSIGFITKGLIRSYYTDKDGNEITVRFYAENDYAVHYTAFITQQPSKYTFQCLENTELVLLSYENMQWAYKHMPAFERYGRLVAEEILKMQQNRIESFIFQSTEERYLDFIKQYPQIYNRVSLSHLCSYLGIERQTLTRIRQKLARK
ncbi:MAG: Crp/Fnr family transcriptional regulator [Cyclobacteriaceae bacterium]|nr:Crp/Fnr family transcriptional regulator [Cyclobacteriaceae bacterium]